MNNDHTHSQIMFYLITIIIQSKYIINFVIARACFVHPRDPRAHHHRHRHFPARCEPLLNFYQPTWANKCIFHTLCNVINVVLNSVCVHVLKILVDVIICWWDVVCFLGSFFEIKVFIFLQGNIKVPYYAKVSIYNTKFLQQAFFVINSFQKNLLKFLLSSHHF